MSYFSFHHRHVFPIVGSVIVVFSVLVSYGWWKNDEAKELMKENTSLKALVLAVQAEGTASTTVACAKEAGQIAVCREALAQVADVASGGYALLSPVCDPKDCFLYGKDQSFFGMGLFQGYITKKQMIDAAGKEKTCEVFVVTQMARDAELAVASWGNTKNEKGQYVLPIAIDQLYSPVKNKIRASSEKKQISLYVFHTKGVVPPVDACSPSVSVIGVE